MTKAGIAEKIMAGTGISKKESVEMMESVFSIMKSTYYLRQADIVVQAEYFI